MTVGAAVRGLRHRGGRHRRARPWTRPAPEGSTDRAGRDAARHRRVRACAGRLPDEHIATPVLFLTARDATADKLDGLARGDDYVTKPFSIDELVARIRAVLRRPLRRPARGRRRLQFADLVVDRRHPRGVAGGEQPIVLTATEFKLLAFLMRQPAAGPVQGPDPRRGVGRRASRATPTSWRSTSRTCARRSTATTRRSSTPSGGSATRLREPRSVRLRRRLVVDHDGPGGRWAWPPWTSSPAALARTRISTAGWTTS